MKVVDLSSRPFYYVWIVQTIQGWKSNPTMPVLIVVIVVGVILWGMWGKAAAERRD